MIRSGRLDELKRLREIERAAGQAFADPAVGHPDIAAHEPPSVETLAAYIDAGRAWVATDDDDRAIAYVLVDMVDGCAHIEQVSVDPVFRGRRAGAALIDHVEQWAGDQGLEALTLTTFVEVPWNAPYYEQLGFTVVDDPGPELRQIVATEAEHGLRPEERVCMRRPVRT